MFAYNHHVETFPSIQPIKRVLIVDDDVDLCALFKIMVNSLGDAECQSASSLNDVIRLLGARSAPYDLVVLDMNLGPGKPNGIDVLHWIKSNRPCRKIVFMTGHAGSYLAMSDIAHLQDIPILSKPVPSDKLVHLIGRIEMMLGPLSRKKFPGWLAYQEWQIRRSILMISALTMVLQGAGILMDSQAVSSEIFDNLLVWRASHIVYGFLVGAITACAVARRLSYPRLTAVAIITLAPVFPFVWYAQAVYLGHQTHFGIIPGFKLPPLVRGRSRLGQRLGGINLCDRFHFAIHRLLDPA